MGVGSIFVDMKMSYVKQQYRAHGLKSENVEIDGGATVIRCWVPWQQPERGVWSTGESDKPVLLFLHDFVADGTVNWEKQIAAFTKDFNIYVPDLVFFGGSSSSEKERTEAFQAECMVKMLHTLEVYNEVSEFRQTIVIALKVMISELEDLGVQIQNPLPEFQIFFSIKR